VMMALLAVPFFGAIFLKGVNGQGSKRMALIAVAFGALMSVLSKVWGRHRLIALCFVFICTQVASGETN
jgi:hypothetical protein